MAKTCPPKIAALSSLGGDGYKMHGVAFVSPCSNACIGDSSFASSRYTSSARRARVSLTTSAARPTRRSFVCSAQEQETRDADTSPTDNRTERARQAKFDAERLELMAERARLESERAQLLAERKRLELDKYKALREQTTGASTSSSPASESHTGQSAAPSDVSSGATTPNIVDNRQMVNDEQKQTPPVPPPFPPQPIGGIIGVDFPRVSEEDIKIIKEHICGIKTFFPTEIDRSPFSERVVFRGNLRLDPDTALEELESLAKAHGIDERVRLFLLLDPKDGDGPRKPVLVALPAAAVPNQTGFVSTVLALLAGAITLGATLSYGIGIFGFTPQFLDEVAKGNLDEIYYTIPISLGVLAIAAAHELGHRVMAKIRNVKLGLPFFIPSLQVGTFGTITPLESYPRARKDLFDVAAAGPVMGMVCSIAALLAGLIFTSSGTVADWFPQVPTNLFHASILVGTLADILLPPGLREQATLAVHPLTVIGYTGILVNALNLLPIGRLDGGRIVQALYGRVAAGRISAITLILQGLSSIFGNSPLLLFWGLICVFVQRESDYPCRNEIVEPSDFRSAIGLFSLFLMLAVLIPFPDQLGDILGRY